MKKEQRLEKNAKVKFRKSVEEIIRKKNEKRTRGIKIAEINFVNARTRERGTKTQGKDKGAGH